MQFDDLGQRALDTSMARGAQYADVRIESNRTERIEVRNGIVATLSDARSTGYGIRALVDGAWGFAASADLTEAGIDAAAARAVGIARASASIARTRFGEAPKRAYVDRFATPMLRDPQSVPLGDRVALLLEAEKALHSTSSIAVGRAWIDLWSTEKVFFSTIGSQIRQHIVQTGSGVEAMAVGEGDVQSRTFPGDVGLYKSGGWEIVEQARLVENAARIGEEATSLLTAPQCPSGTFDIILGGSQMSLQIHESCGHPAELDRVMGWEANFSGTSFLELSQLNALKYGSDLVSIVIDNTLPGGMATCGYDDEGTKSIVSDIIRDGTLAGYEMSNDTAR
ncbi:MAG: TldD/PmbA family protein, partial [Candidatus Eremiobacteraeota bacterium]|nr:TldD/PmbA family protein [Candidatus Eremiobacteraeota bacterium]